MNSSGFISQVLEKSSPLPKNVLSSLNLAMKIWHIGASFSPEKVCGVNNTVWLVAQEQAKLGYDVTLILIQPPNQAALEIAQKTGLKLIYLPANLWYYDQNTLETLLTSQSPNLVHTHSVFVPKQVSLAKKLGQRGIPYVITPHAMTPQLLQRGWLKKRIYSWLFEKPRFLNAAAITVVTPKEEETVRNFVPSYSGIICCVPNPITLLQENSPEECLWQNHGETNLVYMGRFDVLHKGLDILIEIARFLPNVKFKLYGTEHQGTQKWFKKLQQNRPDNVEFHHPVFKEDKTKVLLNATLYIQMSRWEVFGISIAEAMCLGVPCAIANTLNFAPIFQEHDLGLVLSSQPQKAAQQLQEILQKPQTLEKWSKTGRHFAQEQFHPRQVALKYLELYQQLIPNRQGENS